MSDSLKVCNFQLKQTAPRSVNFSFDFENVNNAEKIVEGFKAIEYFSTGKIIDGGISLIPLLPNLYKLFKKHK